MAQWDLLAWLGLTTQMADNSAVFIHTTDQARNGQTNKFR